MRKDGAIWALGILAVLYLVYGVVLRIPFAFHNDLGALTYVHGGDPLAWPEGKQLLPVGRLLNCLMANYQFSFINQISDFTVFRALAIGILGVLTLASWAWLAKRGVDLVVAAAVALSIFLLPTMQLSVVWNTQLVPCVAPLLLVLGAAWLMHRSPEGQAASLLQGLTGRKVAASTVASLLLTVVNFIYPPTAAAFLVSTLACVLFLPINLWPGTRRLVARDLLVYFASCGLFFVMQKSIVGPYSVSLLPPGVEHGDPTFRLDIGNNILENFVEVFGTGGAIVTHLWDIRLSPYSLAAVLVVLLAGLATAVVTRRRASNQDTGAGCTPWAQYAAAVVVLVVAGNTPNLVCPKALIAFRTLFVMSAMLAMIVGKALLTTTSCVRETNRKFVERLSFVTLAVLLAISAQATVEAAAINAHYELQVARNWLLPNRVSYEAQVLRRYRGVSDEAWHSGRATLYIQPLENVLGMYLPMEFGYWHRWEDIWRFAAREGAGVGLDKHLNMREFIASVREGHEVWTRPNPWPPFWAGLGSE